MPRRYYKPWLGAWIVTLLLTGTSGCRFGNRIETAPNPDQITGYYETAAESLTFCADHSTTVCQPAAVTDIPPLVSMAMTNPVALLLDDPSTGSSILASTDGTDVALPVFASSDPGELSFLGATPAGPLWTDPDCLTQLYLEESGTFTRSPTGRKFNGLDVSGRIALRFQVIRIIEGNCATTLQTMQSCYDDANACGGSSGAENAGLQQTVQDIFNPYIQAGVMTSSDISQVTTLQYEAVYQ